MSRRNFENLPRLLGDVMPVERVGPAVFRWPIVGPRGIVLTLVGKPPAAEVAANLRRLKQVLETGTVTDTDHAVAGTFERRATGR
ncbi:hypothetical protein GCM10022225_69170 [Plantactinospora mayteni]|uniref:Uncharacterized protein n=1 Tax=Plantactinospora mayteni TaxID=566021 RepID=A0ABQ4F0Q1_9ACTN|nr:hypothetical protein [Plantactinospora mayteni]GIH00500.1 hypothetical protein Pma05_70720 [Plantactinospora mayteni]